MSDFEAFFRAAPGLFLILDRSGGVRAASGRCHEVLDIPPGGGGAPWIDLVHPDDRGRAQASLTRALGGAGPGSDDLRLRCKGGDHRCFQWSLSAGEDALHGVLSDRANELQETRRFRFLVEAMPDMIGTSDFAGNTTYINTGGLEMLGWTLAEAQKTTIMAFVPEHLHARYQTEILPAVMRDGKWSGEVQLMRRDGSVIPINQVVVVVPDESGRPEALATLARDITEQKRLESALRQAIEELSTPMIQVWEGVLALPIIGVVDSDRAAQMMHSLLSAIASKSCRVAVLDLTGVRTLDTATVQHLFRMVRAASLLGSRCVVSGISPAMAQTVAALGLDMGHLQAFRSLEEALRHAMREAGA